MSKQTQKAGAGAALVESIIKGLPPGIELDERERTLLDQAARQADDIAALEADIAEQGIRVPEPVIPSSIRRSPRLDREGSRWESSWAPWSCPRALQMRAGEPKEPLRPAGSERADGAAHLPRFRLDKA